MTAQEGEGFLFNDQEFWIEGLTGGDFLRAEDFGISPDVHGRSWRSSLWRGYSANYGIDTNGTLVVKNLMLIAERAEDTPTINGIRPMQGKYSSHHHYYDLNFPFPLTGYILFTKLWPTWMLALKAWAMIDTVRQEHEVYELQAVEGKVVDVQNITAYALDRIVGKAEDTMPQIEMYKSNTEQFLADFQDWTATFLPHRYDILYWAVNYVDLNNKKAAL